MCSFVRFIECDHSKAFAQVFYTKTPILCKHFIRGYAKIKQ